VMVMMIINVLYLDRNVVNAELLADRMCSTKCVIWCFCLVRSIIVIIIAQMIREKVLVISNIQQLTFIIGKVSHLGHW